MLDAREDDLVIGAAGERHDHGQWCSC